MAKFFYKMQNILNIKYRLEDQAKTAYGEARAILNEEEERLQVLEKKKEQYEEKIRIALSGDIDEETFSTKLNLFDIIKYENAVETIKYHIKLQILRVRQAEHNLEKAQEHLNYAMMERKTYEKLRENAFEEFKKEVEAEEQKEIDELVSFKYNKTTSGEEE